MYASPIPRVRGLPQLRTQIAPIPGPHRRFRVRVVRQRTAAAASPREAS